MNFQWFQWSCIRWYSILLAKNALRSLESSPKSSNSELDGRLQNPNLMLMTTITPTHIHPSKPGITPARAGAHALCACYFRN
jgi:hypothetical protein